MHPAFPIRRRLPALLLAVAVAVATAAVAASPAGNVRAQVRQCEQDHSARAIGPEELAGWDVMGPGKAAVVQTEDGPAVEFRGSKPSPDSIVLLSPAPLARNAVLRFRIRFQVPRSLVVMVLSASTPQTGADLVMPEKYAGWWFWGHRRKAHAQSYLFSIHTAFHQPEALLRKRPGKGNLDAEPDTLTDEGRWYAVELGTLGGSLWLERDGEPLLSAADPEPLPGGRAGFLFTGDGDASVQIRDLSILECGS